MKRHKVTRKTKSGKTITYWRGTGTGKSEVKGIKGKKKKMKHHEPEDTTEDIENKRASLLKRMQREKDPERRAKLKAEHKQLRYDLADSRASDYQASQKKKGSKKKSKYEEDDAVKPRRPKRKKG